MSKPKVGERYIINSWPAKVIRSDKFVVEYNVYERDGSEQYVGKGKRSQIGWQEDSANGEIVNRS